MNGVADHEEDSGTTSDEDDEVDDDISHDPRPNGVLNGTADSGVSSDAMQHEQHNQDRTDEYRSQDKINGPGVSNLPIMNGQNYARASEPDDEEEAAGHHAQDVRDKGKNLLRYMLKMLQETWRDWSNFIISPLFSMQWIDCLLLTLMCMKSCRKERKLTSTYFVETCSHQMWWD